MARSNFTTIDVRLPRKVANPALNACDWSFPAINSPTKAPINSPKIIPKGGKNSNPIIIPTAAPHMPVLDAPYFLAPKKGKI